MPAEFREADIPVGPRDQGLTGDRQDAHQHRDGSQGCSLLVRQHRDVVSFALGAAMPVVETVVVPDDDIQGLGELDLHDVYGS